MSALIIERKTPKLGQDAIPSFPTNLPMGIAAAAKIWSGAIVCLATTGANSGFLVQGQSATGLVCLGVAERTYDNTYSGNTAGGITMVPRQGVYLMNVGTGVDAIAATAVGQDCFIIDDNTVGLTNGGGARSRAGVVVAVDSGTPPFSQPTGVWVLMGITGSSSAYGEPLTPLLDVVHEADYATAVALAAYTAAGGVLTANANGALAAIDGITCAAGDRVLLTTGAAAADNGLYVITSLGGASAKFVFTRAFDWLSGASLPPAVEVAVNKGTLYGSTRWFCATSGAVTVDTTACNMYPEEVTQAATLVAGTVTLTNVPLLSATKSRVSYNRTTPNTTASTVIYSASTMTPGLVGTASVVFQAQIAAGTINAADISTLNMTVINL